MSESPKDITSLLSSDVVEKMDKVSPVLDLLGLGKKVEKDGAKKDTKAETNNLLGSLFGDKFTDLMSKEFQFLGTTLTLGGLLGISAKKTESTDRTQIASVVITPEGEKFLQEHPTRLEQIATELGTVKDSPITPQMVVNASTKYQIPSSLLLAFMKNDSALGTTGLGAKTCNPGNVGNTDDGTIKRFDSWEAGVDACAENINQRIQAFHDVYGENEQYTAQMLASNQGPDGKGFLPKQRAYKEENPQRFGAYMTAKNGPETVQKIAHDIEMSMSTVV